MTLAAGPRLGRYESARNSEAGGMGEVYRARDTGARSGCGGESSAFKLLCRYRTSCTDSNRKPGRWSTQSTNILSIYDVGKHTALLTWFQNYWKAKHIPKTHWRNAAGPTARDCIRAADRKRLAAAHEKESFIATSKPDTSSSNDGR